MWGTAAASASASAARWRCIFLQMRDSCRRFYCRAIVVLVFMIGRSTRFNCLTERTHPRTLYQGFTCLSTRSVYGGGTTTTSSRVRPKVLRFCSIRGKGTFFSLLFVRSTCSPTEYTWSISRRVDRRWATVPFEGIHADCWALWGTSIFWVSCFVSGVGIYYGTLVFGSQSPGDKVIGDYKLIPYPVRARSSFSSLGPYFRSNNSKRLQNSLFITQNQAISRFVFKRIQNRHRYP